MASSYVSGGVDNDKNFILSIPKDKSLNLFNRESVSQFSALVRVRQGESIRMSVFGLYCQNENAVFIEKVLLKHPDGAHGDGCKDCIPLNPSADIVSQEHVNCGGWKLDPCHTEMYLSTPGVYQFVMNRSNMLGRVIVQLFNENRPYKIEELDIERLSCGTLTTIPFQPETGDDDTGNDDTGGTENDPGLN